MAVGRTIVVPLASPDTAPWLGRLAAQLAAPDAGTVIVVTVLTPDSTKELAAQAQRTVDRAATAVRELGVKAIPQVVHGQRVPTAVLDTVDEHDASLVLMGWKGESTSQNIFGELIDSVMGQSRVPLAVVRPASTAFGRVLFPINGDHLLEQGIRGVTLAINLATRLQEATGSTMLIVQSGRTDQPLPAELQQLRSPTIESDTDLPQTLGHVGRAGDMIVCPVALTTEGLRSATTHIAWATPSCWQLVAIDVGPPTPVDVVTAVKDAGLMVEPVPELTDDIPHVVEVSVTVAPGSPDPWPAISSAVQLVGETVGHHVVDRDGGTVVRVNVRVQARSSAAALSALMVELDDARRAIGATALNYRLVGSD